ncbi:glycosyltransferase family 2 protein [Bacillus sp. SM2101]|uniref:glycosyltransferase family 2 protein n=1 Tax=Bacillus sp. SM2101 TaxID=2805366 RepID=UPI001BDF65A1|nr:glycosyltransferase family 2 protein [Bacillus sp. SM2101]
MQDEFVSIIIPTYKRADLLERAIASVLNQSYTNIEVIVVDDNDPHTEYRKKTESIMKKFITTPNVIYFKHDRNKNGASARNSGIKLARGQYIGFLDDDDEFHKDKVWYQVKELRKTDGKIGAVYCDFVVKDNNQIIRKNRYNKEGNLQFDVLCNKLNISGSNFLFKKNAVENTGFYDERFNRHQDLEFLVRFFNDYKTKYINKSLLSIYKDDRANILDTAAMEKIKKQFLSKYEGIIQTYQKRGHLIYFYNYLEIYKQHLLNKDFLAALKCWKKYKLGLRVIPSLLNRQLYKLMDKVMVKLYLLKKERLL